MSFNAESRRQFFNRGARFLVLGGMGAYVAGQAVKNRRLKGDPDCLRVHPCRDCLELGGCAKPKAVAFRKEG